MDHQFVHASDSHQFIVEQTLALFSMFVYILFIGIPTLSHDRADVEVSGRGMQSLVFTRSSMSSVY
jgi:hypothetical protein